MKEEISNGDTVPKVSTRITADILLRDTMEKELAVEKVNRWCLGGEAFAKAMTGEGGNDEVVTTRTMES